MSGGCLPYRALLSLILFALMPNCYHFYYGSVLLCFAVMRKLSGRDFISRCYYAGENLGQTGLHTR